MRYITKDNNIYTVMLDRDEFLKQLSMSIVLSLTVFEKYELEQIDDKQVMRFTARKHFRDGSILDRDDPYIRYQTGFIYKPSLLILYSDIGELTQQTISLNPMHATAAYIWQQMYSKLPRKLQVACLGKQATAELLELKPIIVQHILWTDEYELPPLSVSAINKTYDFVNQNKEQPRML